MNDPLQDEAVRLCAAGANTFITGPGGCGKSYTVGRIVEALEAQGKVVKVTSSTGISAILLNLGATTIHMLFNMGDVGDRPVSYYIGKLQKAENLMVLRLLRALDVLVIDEISMVQVALMRKIDFILRDLRSNPQPFGGVQLILSGDFAQLPQITIGRAEKPPLLFNTPVWHDARVQTVLLGTDHRQQNDASYASLLKRVRLGRMTDEDVRALKGREILGTRRPPPGSLVSVLVPRNDAADATNLKFLHKLDPRTERVYRAEYAISVEKTELREPGEVERIRAKALDLMTVRAPEILTLRVGARVMLCTNWDLSVGLGNGTLGKVVGFSAEGNPMVAFATPCGGPREVPVFSIVHKSNGTWSGYFNQIPLMLAWAMTIHKSQGATLSKVVADLRAHGMGWSGAAYTALSRVRSIEDIWFVAFERAAVFADPEVVRFYDDLAAPQAPPLEYSFFEDM